MTIRYNVQTLTRLEKLFDEAGYILRYEKGTFNSGYCILEDRKVVVVNRFLSLEGRINTLLDILPLLDIPFDQLTLDSQKLLSQSLKAASTPLSQLPGDQEA
ncbi:MAG TPA: hypothetical protein VMV20_01660 [Chitinophagaceae bacterium]|nr:hypothetical protein [Chitinophagaceae bacterium]